MRWSFGLVLVGCVGGELGADPEEARRTRPSGLALEADRRDLELEDLQALGDLAADHGGPARGDWLGGWPEPACTAPPLPDLATTVLDERVYPPAEVDPALAEAPYCVGEPQVCGVGDPFPHKRHHVKVPAGGATRDELVLFLTGSGGECAVYEVVPRIAAAAGYRTVCLGYPNEPLVEQICAGSADPACTEQVRTEILYGTDTTDLIGVTAPNSVAGRLAALLAHLGSTDPEGGWDRYLDGDEVRWDLVVGVGFSQGAGHVGLLGRDHALARLVLLSGGGNAFEGELAPWCYDPRATAAEATFLYWHREEPVAAGAAELASLWVGEGAEPVDADLADSPFGCAQALTTGRATAGTHGITGWDPFLVLDADGWPVDRQVHGWMLLGTLGEQAR